MVGERLLTVEELHSFIARNNINSDYPVMVAVRPSAYSELELWRVGLQPSFTSRLLAVKDEHPLKEVTYLNTVSDLLEVATRKRNSGDYSQTPLSFSLRSGASFKTSSSGYDIDRVVITPNGLHLSLVLL